MLGCGCRIGIRIPFGPCRKMAMVGMVADTRPERIL
jgi:hypothetical protein